MTEEQIRMLAQFLEGVIDDEVIIEDDYIFIPPFEVRFHRDTGTIQFI